MRQEELVAGIHAVVTALTQHPERVAAVWISAERTDARVGRVLEAVRAAGIRFHRVPRAKLDEMAGDARHQGVVARLRTTPVGGEKELEAMLAAPRGMPLLLVLDGVQDPHNLGACLRVADGAGVHGVVVPRDRSAPLSAAARRAAAGAAETVPVFEVTNLARTLDAIKAAGVWLYGAAQEGATPLYAAELSGPAAVVMGGEERGLRRLTRERCDVVVRIPMAGSVESLNVSVAAGIVLYEIVRQRAARARAPV